MSMRKMMFGAAAVLAIACSTAGYAAPRTAVDLIDSPLATPMARFDGFILDQASGDVKLARVMKEQWMAMYNSLSPTAQGAIYGSLGSADERGFLKIVQKDLPIALAHQQKGALNRMLAADGQKLAAGDPELVFVPSAPCRVSDSRLWSLGAMPPFRSRQIFGWSAGAGFNYNEQGGTGTAGSGDCSATVFASATPPLAAMVTVVAIAGAAPGNFRAWNGNTTLPAASMINFTAGQVIANTTVIPMLRSGAAHALSDNAKRDFAIFNDSPQPSHVIADVVGYFIKPLTYALACTDVDSATLVSTTTGFKSRPAPACAAGSTRTGLMCQISGTSGANLQSTGFGASDQCEWTQTTTTSNTFIARSICCTLP